MKIYVASSWRNNHFDRVVKELREDGHDVYDFKDEGFSWKDVVPAAGDNAHAERWTVAEWRERTQHPLAAAGFERDMNALRSCDACVLVLPSGRSAHLEAGWAIGANKRVIIYAPEPEQPELMYLAAADVFGHLSRVRAVLR